MFRSLIFAIVAAVCHPTLNAFQQSPTPLEIDLSQKSSIVFDAGEAIVNSTVSVPLSILLPENAKLAHYEIVSSCGCIVVENTKENGVAKQSLLIQVGSQAGKLERELSIFHVPTKEVASTVTVQCLVFELFNRRGNADLLIEETGETTVEIELLVSDQFHGQIVGITDAKLNGLWADNSLVSTVDSGNKYRLECKFTSKDRISKIEADHTLFLKALTIDGRTLECVLVLKVIRKLSFSIVGETVKLFPNGESISATVWLRGYPRNNEAEILGRIIFDNAKMDNDRITFRRVGQTLWVGRLKSSTSTTELPLQGKLSLNDQEIMFEVKTTK